MSSSLLTEHEMALVYAAFQTSNGPATPEEAGGIMRKLNDQQDAAKIERVVAEITEQKISMLKQILLTCVDALAQARRTELVLADLARASGHGDVADSTELMAETSLLMEDSVKETINRV
jgi:hypothetical protein